MFLWPWINFFSMTISWPVATMLLPANVERLLDVLFKFVDVEVLFRELHCKYVNEQSLAKLICPPEASHELFIFYLFYFPQTSRDLISMVYVTIEVPALYYLGKVQMVHHRFPIIRDHRSSYRPLLLFSTGEFHNKSVNDLVPRDQSWSVYR